MIFDRDVDDLRSGDPLKWPPTNATLSVLIVCNIITDHYNADPAAK